MQRVGASSGTLVIALILHQQLAVSWRTIAEAFAHTFAWVLGFIVVTFVAVRLLPAKPPRPRTSPDTRIQN